MESELARGAPSAERTPPVRIERLVLALVSVAGASAACADHGDAPTVDVLREYYALVARSVAAAQGRVVKVLGDGVLVAFPTADVHQTLEALRSAQAAGTALWSAFDGRCRVVVRVGAGPVVRGPLGPPGEERDDVYGDTLNRLFKTSPTDDFLVVAPATRDP